MNELEQLEQVFVYLFRHRDEINILESVRDITDFFLNETNKKVEIVKESVMKAIEEPDKKKAKRRTRTVWNEIEHDILLDCLMKWESTADIAYKLWKPEYSILSRIKNYGLRKVIKQAGLRGRTALKKDELPGKFGIKVTKLS